MDIIQDYIRTVSGFHVNVKLLLLRSFIISLYTGIYGIIFNLYVLNMGYRTDFLGLLLAVHLLSSSVMSIPAGILCDRFNKKKLLLASGILSLAVTIPLYITSSPYLMLVLSALGGIFWSISAVAITPLLAENCHADDNVHVFSANASLGWIASVAGCALGGLIPAIWASFFGWGSSYRLTLLTSVLLLAAGLGLAALLKTGHAQKHSEPFSLKEIHALRLSLKDFRISPDVIKFTLTSVTFGIASGMIVPYFNIYFIKVLKVSVLEVGLASAVAGAVMVIGFLATPYLTSKIGKVRSAVLTKILSAPFLILMALTTNFVTAAMAYAAYMFLINMAGPATTSFQMELIKPREQGFAVGMMSMGSYIAISASTYVSGLLIAHGNYLIPFIGTCVAYLATAGLLYHYFKDCERPGFICQKAMTPPTAEIRQRSL